MNTDTISNMLKCFAAGDALGMPTEFMTLDVIHERFGIVSSLLRPEDSMNHGNLPTGSITDDTEQVLYLLKRYYLDGEITPENSTEALLSWIRETGAVEKKYIGPSSLKALLAVEAGDDYHYTGLSGTTCGGVMRTIAPFIFAFSRNYSEIQMEQCIDAALLATHNTSQALEASYAYAYALAAAYKGMDRRMVVEEAIRGGLRGRQRASHVACSAGTSDRLEFLLSWVDFENMDDDCFMRFIYGVFGTSLESYDVASAALAIYLKYGYSVYKSISIAASIGGDTDTIAALVGPLSYLSSNIIDIPSYIMDIVMDVNRLDFSFLH